MENHLLFKIIRFTFSKKPNKRIFCWVTVFVIANLLLSCSFNPHYQGVLPEKAQYDAEAPINQILRYGKALRITEAYKDHNLIYLNSKNDDKRGLMLLYLILKQASSILMRLTPSLSILTGFESFNSTLPRQPILKT